MIVSIDCADARPLRLYAYTREALINSCSQPVNI